MAAMKINLTEAEQGYQVTCATCGNIVCDPEVLRCPRCFKPLFQGSACNGNCKNCLMKKEKCGNC